MGQRIERNAFPSLITHDHLAGLIWSRSLNGWPPAGVAGPGWPGPGHWRRAGGQILTLPGKAAASTERDDWEGWI
jgi:hypothetical protein